MNRWIHRAVGQAVVLGLIAAGTAGCVVLRPGATAGQGDGSSTQRYTEILPLPEDRRDQPLRFGSQVSSPPLNFYAEDNTTVRGINADIAEAVAEKLGVTVQWTQLPFAGLIPAVQSGKIDAGIDLIGDTESRRGSVDFSNYMNQATSPLVRAGNPEGISGVEDLCGMAVAVVRGGVQIELAEEASAECAEQGKPGLDVNQYNNPGDARLAVQSGRVVAFLGNTPVMRFIAEAPATSSVFDVAGETTYQRAPIGIITAKSETELRESIRSALDLLRADGTIDEILARWDVSDLALEAAEPAPAASPAEKTETRP